MSVWLMILVGKNVVTLESSLFSCSITVVFEQVEVRFFNCTCIKVMLSIGSLTSFLRCSLTPKPTRFEDVTFSDFPFIFIYNICRLLRLIKLQIKKKNELGFQGRKRISKSANSLSISAIDPVAFLIFLLLLIVRHALANVRDILAIVFRLANFIYVYLQIRKRSQYLMTFT